MKNKKYIGIIFICILFLVCFVSCKTNDTVVLEQSDNNDKDVEPTDIQEKNNVNPVNSSETVCVHVCGCVKNPGVYVLDVGQRVVDAINKAGGFLKEADEDYINQASILNDEQKIYVPNVSEQLSGAQENTAGKKISINSADKEALMTITGIGSARADSIIDYRQNNGRFKKIDDIMKISGIKKSMFEKIKDQISVD